MDLSVVIPTYRRPELLARCLDSLQRQDVDPARFEVVVVDDGSGDATTGLLAAAANGGTVVALTQPRNAGPAAARNRGIHTATGELVLFLDDDVVAAPDLLSVHLAIHSQRADPLLGVLGRVDWDPSLTITSFMHWLDTSGLQFAYDTWLREGPVEPPYAAFYTANLSMRRELLVAENGFDERFPYPAFEDIELAFRLTGRGFHLDYQPSARGFHTRAMDLHGFAGRMHKVGESAELIRRAAPEFPLDDEQLAQQDVSTAELFRRALRAAAGGKRGRAAYYWAVVGRAYARGREHAARSTTNTAR
jgi:glycosyltransferase involved in cell wall biosynthesis